MTRLAACLRTGDLDTAAAAAARAQMLLTEVPAGKLARHPAVAARVLSGRGTIELWQAAWRRRPASCTRVPPSLVPAGSTNERTAPHGSAITAETVPEAAAPWRPRCG
jgi:hypothetical protein